MNIGPSMRIDLSQIDQKAIIILAKLLSEGKKSYLVGGCVRDLLLKEKPKDFDICTDASHEDLLKIFPTAEKIGVSFGVILQDGIEIASFRNDGAYSDHRRPDSVQLVTDPYEDSCRRDFTINAM